MSVNDENRRARHKLWPDTAFPRSVVLCMAVTSLVVWLGGCASQQVTPKTDTAETELIAVRAELQAEIDEFIDYFRTTIERAAADIERRSESKEQRRAAVLWRVRMISECRSAADESDARASLLDLWVLCQRMLDYFTTGDGKSLFGVHQEIAREAATVIHEAFERLARQSVLEDSFESLRSRVVAYAREHPIEGQFAGPSAEDLSDSAEGTGLLDAVVGIPLSPLTTLWKIGRTQESVHNVSVSMDRFTNIVKDFPANTRWQAQLLAMNLEEMPAVSETITSLKQFSDSSARFTQVMDNMPRKVREEAEELLDRLETSQPEIRTTMGEVQNTFALVQSTNHDIQDTIAEANRSVAGVQDASAALEKAANAVTITTKEILKFVPAAMKDESGQIIGRPRNPKVRTDSENEVKTNETAPASSDRTTVQEDTSFSFQAVTASANALGRTSEDLNRLLADLRDFLDDKTFSNEVGALDQQLRRSIDSTGLRVEGIVDHIAKRSAQLLLLLFALVVTYRIISTRLPRAHVPS